MKTEYIPEFSNWNATVTVSTHKKFIKEVPLKIINLEKGLFEIDYVFKPGSYILEFEIIESNT